MKNNLEPLIDRVAGIPHSDPAECPKVVITGDFSLASALPSWRGSTTDMPNTGSF